MTKFVEIVEKPEYKHYINSGINVFSKEALSNLDNFEELFEFINEFKNKEQIKKYEIKDYWIDVGTKESLQKAIKEW